VSEGSGEAFGSPKFAFEYLEWIVSGLSMLQLYTTPTMAASSSCMACKPARITFQHKRQPLRCMAAPDHAESTAPAVARRELLLSSVNVGVLASLFTFGAAPRPSNLGVQDYGDGIRTLQLCPPKSKNCIGSADEANDMSNYVPGWTYNDPERCGRKKPVDKAQAMQELREVVSTLKPDKFEPTIVRQTDDYLYAEFQSPTFGFIDDVEFFFTGKDSQVDYRSASRIGESDGDINRKRIRAIRKELEKKGWKSIGF